VTQHVEPLTEPVFFVLLGLEAGPLHGYGLAKEAARLSEGRVRLTTGTLYGAIRRLVDAGWIAEVEAEDTARGKRAYKITREGRARLRGEVARLRQLIAAAPVRLGGVG